MAPAGGGIDGTGFWLLTGGASFIGTHLCRAPHAAGGVVRVLDDCSTGHAATVPHGCDVLRGDVADPTLLRHAFAGVAGCFHLAAIASVACALEDWAGTHRVDAGGSVAVLDAAGAAGCVPVVYASSSAVYGNQGSTIGVVARLAAGVAADEELVVHGDGLQVRDVVFVADAVAHLRAAKAVLRGAPGAGFANVCTGRPTTVLDLAAGVGRATGRMPRLRHVAARTGDIRHSLGDPGLAAATLGLRAATMLDDGLRATIAP